MWSKLQPFPWTTLNRSESLYKQLTTVVNYFLPAKFSKPDYLYNILAAHALAPLALSAARCQQCTFAAAAGTSPLASGQDTVGH